MKPIKAFPSSLSIFLLLLISFISCDDDIIIQDTRQAFSIPAWDYSENHYFLDTVYKESFEDFFNNSTISSQTQNLAVDDLRFEVWVQTDVTTIGYRLAGLHVDLTELPSNGYYNDSLKVVPTPEAGLRAFGRVRKLRNLYEYRLNRFAGYVSITVPVPDNIFVGVAYKRPVTGEQFGTISTDSGSLATDTLVLKMVKVQNLIPNYLTAWNLQLRNIYQLPKTDIVRDGFEFYIYYLENNLLVPYLPGVSRPLIQIFHLDRFTNGRTGFPDNKFDYIPGLTIDPDNGWVIFPSLKPFLTDMQNYNNNGKSIDSVYWYPQIYNGLKASASLYPNANKYFLKGYVP